MTNDTKIKLGTVAATLLDSILAYGDRVAEVPGVPPWLAHAWPYVFLFIVAADRTAHILLGDAPANIPATGNTPATAPTIQAPAAKPSSQGTFGAVLLFCMVGVSLITACTIIPTQHGKAQFWGDYSGVTFSDGSVHFAAASMIHSRVVQSHWHGLVLLGGEAVSSAIPGVGVGTRAAAAAVPSLVSGFTQSPRSTPIPAHPAVLSAH